MSVRTPCRSCPWRVDQDAEDIPFFKLDLAEGLADTCGKPGQERPLDARWFGCHQSRPGEEFVCAGWLAVVGIYHLGVRAAVIHGRYDHEALYPGEGWPELHKNYDEVIDKLRRTT